jgi:ABC-type amino acid transport substrate-binding protein
MNETKKRGRPPKASDETDRQELSIPKGYPQFVETLEKYLIEGKWTKRELMSAIGLGDTQLYRWGRGESVPRKATVNRIAVHLAQRLDKLYGSLPNDPSPATDAIDSLLNELLEAAGFAASVKGKSSDDCWNKIAQTKCWTLGYTMVPEWSMPPDKYGNKPTGKAIEYAERVGRLLGIQTRWIYLNFDEMPTAIRQRQVDGIAPLMVVLPSRLFDYSFSDSCADGEFSFSLSAITSSQLINGAKTLEDIAQDKVKLLFVQGELGDWGREILLQYASQAFSETDEAISYIAGVIERQEDVIPILLVDSVTGAYLIKREKDLDLLSLKVESIELDTYNAFAFHHDEKRLLESVNKAIPKRKSIPMPQLPNIT